MNKIEELAHNLFKGKVITLPKAPSVNHLYGITCRGGFAHKYMTAKGKVWFEEAGYKFKSQWDKKEIEGEIIVYIKLFYCGRYDWDNCLKVTNDLLTDIGVIKDDSQIMAGIVVKERVPHRTDEKMEVVIDASRYD